MTETIGKIMQALGQMTYELKVIKADEKFITCLDNALNEIRCALDYYIENETPKDKVK